MARPELSLFDISPRTVNQQNVLKTLQAKDLVFVTGPAGTGKTFLAMYQALRDLAEGKSRRIVLTRPATEASGEELGFLPGDLEEKMYPYMLPLSDAISKILRQPFENAPSFAAMLDKGLVEIAPLAYMRGRDLNKCTVVCDEAQNTNVDQMLMLLTRIGKHCKMYVCGDLKQRDVENSNGFAHALSRLRDSTMIGIAGLDETDIQRSAVVKEVLRLWETDDVIHEEEYNPYAAGLS